MIKRAGEEISKGVVKTKKMRRWIVEKAVVKANIKRSCQIR